MAKKNLIQRIQRRFNEDERTPAVGSHRELVFAEVTVAPDAKPGRREIRVITKQQGISNALPFYVAEANGLFAGQGGKVRAVPVASGLARD